MRGIRRICRPSLLRLFLTLFVIVLFCAKLSLRQSSSTNPYIAPSNGVQQWCTDFLTCKEDFESPESLSYGDFLDCVYREVSQLKNQRSSKFRSKDLTAFDTQDLARIGYFIQVAPNNLETLSRLFRVLYDSENLYVIHFDKKIDDTRVRLSIREIGQVVQHASNSSSDFLPDNIFLLPRKYVSYMGISMVLNTIAGMQALTKMGWFDFFINLSGSDYPLVSQLRIRQILGHARKRDPLPNFVWTDDQPEKWRSRISELHFDPAIFENVDALQVIQDFPLVKASPSTVQHPFANQSLFSLSKCEAWMIISRQFVEYIIESTEAKEMLLRFAHSLVADEHYFCSLMHTRKESFPQINSTLRFILWWHPQLGNSGARPFPLDDKWWIVGKSLRCSGALFARKFSHSNSEILDMIDNLFIRELDKEYIQNVASRFREVVGF
eukprot:jgi/Galph1/306/GphlegSOOS_G5089.1